MSLEEDRASGLDETYDDTYDETYDGAAEPSGDERDAWARVRRSATGMCHHEAKEALEDARRAAAGDEALTGRDTLIAQAEIEEWERITEALSGHAGAYDSADDPFVRGELEGRAHHAPTPSHRR
ncbi:hypothetical protein [Streptomyces beigongshangae]|uniref:hypothetical protein n=1 Tax=Streptomyces beigongshangae TaxID=2841597 RepID=UPI001C8481B6|nr:hypothetical protein [Streptomyces sp. REN17]